MAATSNLVSRLLTAAVMVPALLYSLYWAGTPWFYFAIVGTCATIGAHELFAMTLPGERVLQLWGVAASTLMLGLVTFSAPSTYLLSAIALIVIVGMLATLWRAEPVDTASPRMAWLIAGPFYCGGLFGLLCNLFLRDHGGDWVVLAMMFSWFSDTGGYFAGRAFGKRPLLLTVSPKKTIEGSIGGLLGSLVGVLSACFWYLPELPLAHGIGLAIFAGALGQAGDLCESLIKRSVGVKDSGTIVPGHGGVLDRADALLFTSAATWVYVTFVFGAYRAAFAPTSGRS